VFVFFPYRMSTQIGGWVTLVPAGTISSTAVWSALEWESRGLSWRMWMQPVLLAAMRLRLETLRMVSRSFVLFLLFYNNNILIINNFSILPTGWHVVLPAEHWVTMHSQWPLTSHGTVCLYPSRPQHHRPPSIENWRHSCQIDLQWPLSWVSSPYNISISTSLQGSYGQGKSGNFEGVRESQGKQRGSGKSQGILKYCSLDQLFMQYFRNFCRLLGALPPDPHRGSAPVNTAG